MRRRWVAALAAGWVLVACGGGGSLPPGDNGQDPGLTDPDIPGTPVTPGTGNGNGNGGPGPVESTSLWPLTTGSTWVYDINDQYGQYQKHVKVLGPREVPGSQKGMTAVLVHSRQDRTSVGSLYEEYSYQLELTNGLVVRVREEDHMNGQLVRTTTWSPATVKSLARAPDALPWSYKSAVMEYVALGDGSTEDSDPTYNWIVEAVNVTVQTKAGTFTNAIKVKREKLDDAGNVKEGKEKHYWLVPGIGKVREEDGDRTEDLASYKIEK